MVTLTPRERDCLRLLGQGLSTADVATDLGIRKSTLESHLAAARRKLGVATTRQAVLVSALQSRPSPAGGSAVNGEALRRFAEHSALATDVADVLMRSSCFKQGWDALVDAVGALGVQHLSLGLIAEPEGTLSNGGRRIATSFLPQEFSKEIGDPDDFSRDPIGKYVTSHRQGRVLDSVSILDPDDQSVHENLRAIASAYMDCGLRYVYCQPGRDAATMAAHALFYSLDGTAVRDWARDHAALHDECSAISDLFWTIAQERRWLAPFSELTLAQAAALRCLARGFTSAEAAEQLGVSLRGFEKHLAGARVNLKARTNAQAVYRAMVYRAL